MARGLANILVITRVAAPVIGQGVSAKSFYCSELVSLLRIGMWVA
jgi:hypothetical protein